ncbi:MAG: hypothetical protein H0T48_00140 [Gemmatimonadaceae bacterium]|nr:hypothetical protein [Gemmatimonadaceae bacterium]
MTGRATLLVSAAAAMAGAVVACTDIPSEPGAVLSFSVDSLPFPSVVLGDSLRDTAGVVSPLTVTAYNFQGAVIPDVPVRFSTRDRGVSVDSVTGIVTGDSLRSTPARLVARVGTLEAPFSLDVTLRPDTVAAVAARDSLLYSLIDTTVNVSTPLTVRVRHGLGSSDSAVKAWLVTFAIVSPGDTALARLVDEGGRASLTDTTDAGGVAGRRIRLNAARVTSARDSVVLQASVKYRGAHIRGSPVRLVLIVRPRTP